MIFFVIILLFIIFASAKAEKPNHFNRDYISRDYTNNIKGIFVILILFSHGKSYLTLGGTYDEPYIAMQNHFNQMVVAMFLFYSGYGIMEQIKKRGFSYIASIPKKRFLNLLINFDIAVLLYALLAICLGNRLSIKDFLLALTAWEGIGNSSWYIFVTFALYLITFLSFFGIKWVKKKEFKLFCIILLTVLSIGLILLFLKIGKPRYWFNTAILYALGFWYSYFKDTVERVLMKNDIVYFSALGAAVCLYVITYLHRWDRLLVYEVWAVIFTLGIVLITMKVKLESNVLKWFGEHIFSIYILQRIPMIILQRAGVANSHKYIFMIVSIAITIPMAAGFDYLTGRLAGRIWKPKKQTK